MHRLIIVATTAIGLLAVSSGMVSAHKDTFKSKHVIHVEDNPGADDYFVGEVKAPDKCEKDRDFSLSFTAPNGEVSLIGTTSTDSEGDWGIALGENVKKGSYSATVAKKVYKKKDHRHRCLAQVSNVVVVQ